MENGKRGLCQRDNNPTKEQSTTPMGFQHIEKIQHSQASAGPITNSVVLVQREWTSYKTQKHINEPK